MSSSKSYTELAEWPSEPAEKPEKRSDSADSHIENKIERERSYASTTHRPSVAASAAERARRNINAKLANPLSGYSYHELRRMGRAYAYEHAIAEKEDVRAFEIGACLAKNPEDVTKARELGCTEEEIAVLEKEISSRWSQPWTLYLVIMLCSTCAAVQGMDETVVNGAQLFYFGQFGIDGHDARSTWLDGLVNSAPYLCCAFIGCWLTTPFNNWFGRRGTVFITCLFSATACFWQGFVNVRHPPSHLNTYHANANRPGGICLSPVSF